MVAIIDENQCETGTSPMARFYIYETETSPLVQEVLIQKTSGVRGAVPGDPCHTVAGALVSSRGATIGIGGNNPTRAAAATIGVTLFEHRVECNEPTAMAARTAFTIGSICSYLSNTTL